MVFCQTVCVEKKGIYRLLLWVKLFYNCILISPFYGLLLRVRPEHVLRYMGIDINLRQMGGNLRPDDRGGGARPQAQMGL